MKRFIAALIAAVILMPLLSVTADDTDVVFTLKGGTARADGDVTVTLALATNAGISGASVNIIFDYTKIACKSYSLGDAMTCDAVTVSDNGFGQIRFSFCDTGGYFRKTGTLLKLVFSPVSNTASESVVYMKKDAKAISGTSYQELSYSSGSAVVTFTAYRARFESDVYYIDYENQRVTGVPAGLTPEKFAEGFDCEVIVSGADSGSVGTGCVVIADTYDVYYEYTVIVRGDLDGNGTLNSTDYIRLRRILLKQTESDELSVLAGDLNGSGELEPADYIRLRRILLKIDTQ